MSSRSDPSHFLSFLFYGEAKYLSGHFVFVTILSLHLQPGMVVISIPILQMGKERLKRLNYLLKVIQLLKSAFGILYEDYWLQRPSHQMTPSCR